MTPASVVNGGAVFMAWRRGLMTSAERPGWARKQVSRVARRARCAGSCTSILRVIRVALKAGRMPPLHHLWGAPYYAIRPAFLQAAPGGVPVAVLHPACGMAIRASHHVPID